MKNKEIINNIKYSENEIAKKILKKIKNSEKIFYLIFTLETLSYILLIINLRKFSSSIIVSLIYLLFALDISLTHKKHSEKVMKDSINKTVCPEAYIDINLYFANKLICPERNYNYFLNNISYGYILLGKIENAEKIIKYLDTRKKDLFLQCQIIINKIEIAFMNNDINDFNKLKNELNNIIKFIPGKIKKEIKLDIKIKQAIIEKDTSKVNEYCTILEKNKNKHKKIIAEYYRGLVQENKRKQDYVEHYKFVSENGNNLFIAKKARKKINIKEFENKYNIKKYIPYNIFRIIIFIIFISSTIFWGIYTLYRINL